MMDADEHRRLQAFCWNRSRGSFQPVPRENPQDPREARDNRRRVWRLVWGYRRRRGARCGKLERRYYRRHRDRLHATEKRFIKKKREKTA